MVNVTTQDTVNSWYSKYYPILLIFFERKVNGKITFRLLFLLFFFFKDFLVKLGTKQRNEEKKITISPLPLSLGFHLSRSGYIKGDWENYYLNHGAPPRDVSRTFSTRHFCGLHHQVRGSYTKYLVEKSPSSFTWRCSTRHFLWDAKLYLPNEDCDVELASWKWGHRRNGSTNGNLAVGLDKPWTEKVVAPCCLVWITLLFGSHHK